MMDPEYPRTGKFGARFRSWLKYGLIGARKLTIDIIVKPSEFGGDPRYRRVETWTKRTIADLNAAGYKKGIGWHDNIAWMFTPIYVRFHNLKRFDIRQTDAAGNLLYAQDTAATLNDWMQSSATEQFVRGMARARMQGMSLQQIGMIGILIVGAILGLHMLGFF